MLHSTFRGVSSSNLLKFNRSFSSAILTKPIFHEQFDLIGDTSVPEFNIRLHHYVHKKSGAKVISVASDDENKVFGVAFSTPSTDSTGIPHILEHSVLAGSEKYPLRDPFLNMLSGSMQTFLNAMTFVDQTLYPVASTHNKDFYNLASVYADAVLRPLVVKDPKAFYREGHRLCLNRDTNIENDLKNNNLEIQGVVYNEMKGMYAIPEYVLYRAIMEELFCDTAHRHNSGGDPTEIRSLSYENFRKFHSEKYNPSNSHFFFFGNDSTDAKLLEKRLNFVHEQLEGIEPTHKPAAFVPSPQQWKSPRVKNAFVAMNPSVGADVNDPSSTCREDISTLAWMINRDLLDASTLDGQVRALCLQLLTNGLIVGTNVASVQEALLLSNLGSQVISMVDDSLSDFTFMLGLKGMKSLSLDKVDAGSADRTEVEKMTSIIMQKLDELANKTGFDPKKIEAAISSLEFALREFKTSSEPKGVAIFRSLAVPWLRGDEPSKITKTISYLPALEELKRRITAGEKPLEDALRTFFIENNNRVDVLCAANKNYFTQQEASEKKFLQNVSTALTQHEKDNIIKRNEEDKANGDDSDEAEKIAAILPSISVSDLDRQVPSIVHDRRVTSPVDGAIVYEVDVEANGISYVSCAIDVSHLVESEKEISDLSLLIALLGKCATSSKSRSDLIDATQSTFGGISLALEMKSTAVGGVKPFDHGALTVSLRVKGLSSKLDEMSKLLREILVDTKIDEKQVLLELLQESYENAQATLIQSGDSIASSWVNSTYSLHNMISDNLSRSGAINRYRNYLSEVSESPDSLATLINRLDILYKKFLTEVKSQNVLVMVSNDVSPSSAGVNSAALLKALPFHKDDQNLMSSEWTGCTALLSHPGSSSISSYKKIQDALQSELKHHTSKSSNLKGFTIASQVNFNAAAAKVFEDGDQIRGSVGAVCRWINLNPLMKRVRLEGGAYGTRVGINGVTGSVTFSSYRDPASPRETYGNFVKTIEDVLVESRKLSHRDIERAVIGCTADLDRPLHEGDKVERALSMRIEGKTWDFVQDRRNEVFGLKSSDFAELAEKMNLAFNRDDANVRIACVGNSEAVRTLE